jgi:hypothetical protein
MTTTTTTTTTNKMDTRLRGYDNNNDDLRKGVNGNE